VRTFGILALISAFGVRAALPQAAAAQTQTAQTYVPDSPGASHAPAVLTVVGPSPHGWLFPITEADQYLPSWIQFGGQFRNRWEEAGNIGYRPMSDGYDLTQLRLGMYIRPVKWFEAVAVTQDSRVFFNQQVPSQPPYQNVWDIREAYARIGSDTEGLLDLVVGRQMFSFGDERVIGPSDWSNMGRTFDTVRLDLHPKNLNVSIFAASEINAIDGHIDHHIEGNDLYGIYSSFRKLVPRALLEPYLLWRVAPGNILLPETAGQGAMSEVTGGARIAGALPGDFDYDVEMNKQTGSLGHYSIDAWAGHWNVGKTFVNTAGKPRPFVEYNYATGNRNPQGNTWTTHDQIYPSSHDKMEFADQFGWRNIKDLRVGVMQKVAKRWGFTEMINNLWLVSKNDAVYSASGAPYIAPHPSATSTHLGTEVDLIGTFNQNAHVTYGFGLAYLFTGAYLKEATPGKNYYYPFAYVTYMF
jgi:alginate export protein